MTPAPLLIIQVATATEAKALCAHYRLKRCQRTSSFPLYNNRDKSIYLIESGIGKAAAAAAVASAYYLAGANATTVFLNIGIAGGNLALGTVVAIDKIVDHDSQQHFYPSLIDQNKHSYTTLTTYSIANRNYQQDTLMDMEASGFYQSALKFVSTEQIACLKIISDNNIETQQALNKKAVSELMSNALSSIITCCEAWRHYACQQVARHQLPPHYSTLIHQHHFTEYQQHQLLHLLYQWQSLLPDRSLPLEVEDLNNSKDILRHLQNRISSNPINWS